MTTVQVSVPCRVGPGRIASVEFDAPARRLITAAVGDGLEIGYRHGPGLILDVRPRPTGGTALRVGGAAGALSVDSLANPFAVAVVLFALYDATGVRPLCRFPWPRHHRLTVLLGLTGTAAQVRAILQRNEPAPQRRPIVQIGD